MMVGSESAQLSFPQAAAELVKTAPGNLNPLCLTGLCRPRTLTALGMGIG